MDVSTLLGPPGTGRKRPWWLVGRSPRQLTVYALIWVVYSLLLLVAFALGRFDGFVFVWAGIALVNLISCAVSFVAFRRHPEWVGNSSQQRFEALPPLSQRTARRYAFGVGLGMLGCLAGLALTLAGPTRLAGVVLFLVGLGVGIGFTVAIGRRPAN